MNEITQDLVRELFYYRDGNLYRKVSKNNSVKIGDLAGTIRPDGYRSIGIDYRLYRAHRMVFLYHNGFVPEYLDHIDGNPLNNHIENLREATTSQNGMNKKKSIIINGKPPISIYKGVTRFKHNNKWGAYIKINGKQKHLGLFISEIEAGKAYNAAAIEEYGEYAMLNDIP